MQIPTFMGTLPPHLEKIRLELSIAIFDDPYALRQNGYSEKPLAEILQDCGGDETRAFNTMNNHFYLALGAFIILDPHLRENQTPTQNLIEDIVTCGRGYGARQSIELNAFREFYKQQEELSA